MNELELRGSDMTLHCTGREEAPDGSTNIVAHGWVTKEKKVKLLQESTLLLLPSAYEGQPMVALEALACGTPVLASNALHSLPDTIHQPKEETVESWADSIEQIRRTELEVGHKLNQHSVELINERLLSLYQGLIQPLT